MALQIRTRTTWEVSVNLSILNLILTHFLFLTFLARDLRGLANLKVYFSFVNVSDSLGPSSEHNCEVLDKYHVWPHLHSRVSALPYFPL